MSVNEHIETLPHFVNIQNGLLTAGFPPEHIVRNCEREIIVYDGLLKKRHQTGGDTCEVEGIIAAIGSFKEGIEAASNFLRFIGNNAVELNEGRRITEEQDLTAPYWRAYHNTLKVSRI